MSRRSNDHGAGVASKRRLVFACVLVMDSGQSNPHVRLSSSKDKFCDVTLRLGIEVLPAHRVVKAARSTFLAVRFDWDFQDSLALIVSIHEPEMEPGVFDTYCQIH